VKATTALVAINVAVFLWDVLTGGGRVSFISGFSDDVTLINDGALYGPLVVSGEWWRLISSGFVHDGILHIGLNMFALYQVGTFVEFVTGPRRMLTIYFISMLGSGLAVVAFAFMQPTIGASGAIFGLFGALVALGIRLGPRGRGLIMQTLPIILINLVFTFSIPSISKAAHVGGLLIGFIAAFVLVRLPRQAQPEVVGEPVGGSEEGEYLGEETRDEP
jgi:membrane associated rhomboid family serine protease